MWRHRGKFGASSIARPRLLVDVSAIIRHDARTGIQRVVRAIWSELLDRDGQGFALVPVFASHQHGYCYGRLDFLENRDLTGFGQPARAGAGDVFLGLDLSAQFLPRYRPQLRAWRNAGAQLNVVVYDLLPLQRPDWFNPSTSSNFRRWFDVLAADCDRALCISQQVMNDFSAALALRPSSAHRPDVARIRMGGDIEASRPTSGQCTSVSTLLDRMRLRPAILMVGTIEPRKAYDVALAAFDHLWAHEGRAAPDLVIVGKPGWKTADLQARMREHPECGRRLHWMDAVSDEDLRQLYDSSRGLLMTSHGEGFGLPVLEAVLHRRPALARNLSVFRELALPNVCFFDDDAPAALAGPIMRLAEAGAERLPAVPDSWTWRESVNVLLGALGLAPATAAPLAEPIAAARA